MKIHSCAIVLICFFAAVVQADMSSEEAMDAVRSIAQDCRTPDTTDEDVEAMIRDDENSRHESKCLRACLMKKFEVMTESGDLSVEGAIKLAQMMTGDEEKAKMAEEIVNKCKDLKEADECETAFKYGNCMRDEFKALHEEK